MWSLVAYRLSYDNNLLKELNCIPNQNLEFWWQKEERVSFCESLKRNKTNQSTFTFSGQLHTCWKTIRSRTVTDFSLWNNQSTNIYRWDKGADWELLSRFPLMVLPIPEWALTFMVSLLPWWAETSISWKKNKWWFARSVEVKKEQLNKQKSHKGRDYTWQHDTVYLYSMYIPGFLGWQTDPAL